MSRKPVVQVPSCETQAREKLALYVYEYLHHLGAQKTAQIFLGEIGWQKKIELSDSPGFLTSWWSVFWDLYCAAPDRRESRDFPIEGNRLQETGVQGAPVMVMMTPGGEMITNHLNFAGPLGAHMVPFAVGGGIQPSVSRPGSQMPVLSAPGACCSPSGFRMVGGMPLTPNNFDAAPNYCNLASPHHSMPLGGPPSVQSVQSNLSAFNTVPQAVANGHQSRPSPWRASNGSYCVSPFGTASLPESTGMPPSFCMMAQNDTLGGMLFAAEQDGLFVDKANALNGEGSPRGDEACIGQAGSAFAHLADVSSATLHRCDPSENTAAAILKIKESMREEAKRFETPDSSSVMTPSSN